jgi:transcriptional regulator with XRE-family HTH domain
MEACKVILLDEFARRRMKNPSYSLRGFARDLNTNPASLSQFLSGKRTLSKRTLSRLADRLLLSPDDKRAFFSPNGVTDVGDTDASYRFLQQDEFHLISDWYHYAIYTFADTGKAKANWNWLGNKLGISPAQAQSAVERLVRLKLVTIERGVLKRISETLRATSDVPSGAHREYHKQNLKKAEKSIDEDSVQIRDMSSTTFLLDQRDLKEAKEYIGKFRRQFHKRFSKMGDHAVYTLALQLFPITKEE